MVDSEIKEYDGAKSNFCEPTLTDKVLSTPEKFPLMIESLQYVPVDEGYFRFSKKKVDQFPRRWR